jgi:hypothetical protein
MTAYRKPELLAAGYVARRVDTEHLRRATRSVHVDPSQLAARDLTSDHADMDLAVAA